jgi:hypothetical protein
MKSLILTSVIAVGLAACGGGGGGSGGGTGSNPAGGGCRSIPGAAPAALITGCSGCSIIDEGLASDGDATTYATMTVPAGVGGTVAVRATAGSAYPVFTPAGVIFSSDAANQTGADWSIRTYFSGTPQDSGSVGSDGIGSPARRTQHDNISTTRPFDAVEFAFTRASGTTTETVRVYELCTS